MVVQHDPDLSDGGLLPRATIAADRWTARFWLALAMLLAVRIVLIAVLPLDLAADEAYDWDWSVAHAAGRCTPAGWCGW